MPNTRAEGAYQQAVGAFKNPTLDLLHGRYAPFVVAALSLIFTPERPTVAVTDAHIEVGDIAEDLRAIGHEDLPAGTGRDICRYWKRVGWLVEQIEDGTEVYRLSAQAVGALEMVGRVGGGRARVSRSRVRTLLDSVDQLSQDAEPDAEQRLANLQAERDRIDAEMARVANGDVEPVEDDQLLEEVENILHLSRELPADFARVAESINAMQRDVVSELRRDVRPAGEVLREYLHRGEHVMDATPEGRAFAGALKLIGDPEQIDQLTDQVTALLTLPFARMLRPEQRAELTAIARRVEQGVAEVLSAQRRASHVITAQVRTHDPVRDREIDELLRGAMAGLQSWMATDTGSRAAHGAHSADTVDPLRSLPTAMIGHLRQTLSDPRPPSTPEPLHAQEAAPDIPEDDSRAWGGPHYPEIEQLLRDLDADRFDLAATFETAADEVRRPADLLGMLEIAHRNGMTDSDRVDVVEAVRPDGTTRRFAFGAVTAKTRQETQHD